MVEFKRGDIVRVGYLAPLVVTDIATEDNLCVGRVVGTEDDLKVFADWQITSVVPEENYVQV